jgi:lia operon protein LiaG
MKSFLVLGSLALAAGPLAAQSYSLSGDRVAVYNIAGAVTVTGGGSGAVKVQVDLQGADSRQLKVETGTIRGAETLRVIYPDEVIIYSALGRGSNTQMQIREDGTWGNFGREKWNSKDERHRVTIRGSGSGVEAYADLSVTIPAGKTVGIFTGVGRVDVSNVDGDLMVDVGSADITAKGTKGSLDLDTGSGDIRVDNAQGDINLDTGSGNVVLAGSKGGRLSIDTGSGDVTVSDATATSTEIDTGSGGIRIDRITTDRLNLDTGSGDVRADLVTTPNDIEIDTGSGGVTLRLPSDASATVDLETGSGDFTVELPITVTHKEESSLRGKIGAGRSRITIETGSGDINLLK